ncbi:MAG: type I 3-dehydroquinate dehydratase [Phycisphaerales bacterium]|nr:type I 3-dehydroquinate dehydratase [Phycisphaerales bacterium]
MSLIAVAITVESAEQVAFALESAHAAAKRGATIVEWRVDALAHTDNALESVALLVKNSPLPCIVTIRAAAEGGAYVGHESARLELLIAVCKLTVPPSYIDLELAAFQASAEFQKQFATAQTSTRLILSAHDFQTRPADLSKRIGAMWNEPLCAVAKIAWLARSVRDNLEAFELLRHQSKPTIALCMGPFGIASRVLAPKFGGFLTYARPDNEMGTAPGQLTAQEFINVYSFARITPATKLFAVVGWPIEHSLSPLLHNAAFSATQFNGAYVPMAIPPEWEHFKASLGEMSGSTILNLRGVSVTLPHKEHALRWCKQQGGDADLVSEWCGAANTLIFSDNGVTHAFNTDAPAAVAALAGALEINQQHSAALASGGAIANVEISSARAAHVNVDAKTIASQTLDQWRQQCVLVLGAGGAARAVIAGLALTGAHVVIANRTHDKAKQLAKHFNARAIIGSHQSRVEAVALGNIAAHSFTAIVNCTSAGMTGSGAESIDPLPTTLEIKTRMVLMDTVYRPRETPLLRRARAAGAVIVDGTEMFLRQAALQFELFTQDDCAWSNATVVMASHDLPGKNKQTNIAERGRIAPEKSLSTNSSGTSAPLSLWRELLNQQLNAQS